MIKAVEKAGPLGEIFLWTDLTQRKDFMQWNPRRDGCAYEFSWAAGKSEAEMEKHKKSVMRFIDWMKDNEETITDKSLVRYLAAIVVADDETVLVHLTESDNL